MSFTVLIPARYGATRLPGKPLADLGGQPLIRHVYQRALDSGADAVAIATDDARIRAVAEAFGARVVMTAASHASGTDRLAEAAATLGLADETVIVNLQGDEPGMPGAVVRQVAEALDADPGAHMATACAPLADAGELFDPAVVKVVRGAGGAALYFSRAPVPWDRDAFPDAPAPLLVQDAYRRHLGLYAYRAGFLRRFAALEPCALETIERLEQLRALYHGARILVLDACARVGPGIDTAADLEAARAALQLSVRGK